MKSTFLIYILFIIFFIQSCTKDDAINLENGKNTIINKQLTGSSAKDILSDNIYKSMVIEIVYVEGYEPTESAINNFVDFIDARAYKPNGITIEKRAILSLGDTTYSTNKIAEIEDANRTKYNNNEQIAIWAFFSDGKSDKDESNSIVLGIAYRNTSFVIFEETLHNFSNTPYKPNRTLLETTVITHEFGHILGLTNFGTNQLTQHEDTEHPRHCNVRNCLMYWETGSSLNISKMMKTNSAVPLLDAQCLADLRANGGK